jgi:FkbM family methyltransferase
MLHVLMGKYFWRPLRAVAQRLGLYHKLRYSKVYEILLWIRNPNYLRALRNDLAFYKSVLDARCELIFDIGANQGDKTWAFRQMARTVVVVEPDSYSWAALTERFGNDSKVHLEKLALGSEIGVANLYLEKEGSAYNTLSTKQRAARTNRDHADYDKTVEVPVSTIDQLIAKYGVPDYAKIDVEGYELPVLKGLSHQIHIISFEANLPVFRGETLEILSLFEPTPQLRFNLRAGDLPQFVFPVHRSLPEVRWFITQVEGSFDIFVFQD